MERRDFLKMAAGCAAGLVAFAATAEAAPLSPAPLADDGRASQDAQPAVVSGDEVDRLKPEEVRWGHHGHRHWGWHRHRGWGRRHWGWRHRRWHRHRRHW